MISLKLRAVFLGAKEPNEWSMGEGDSKRSGKTYKVSLLLENTDTVLMKVPEALYTDLISNGVKQFAVLDLVMEARVVLEVNRQGRAEQLLKILPTRYELVAANVNDQPAQAKPLIPPLVSPAQPRV